MMLGLLLWSFDLLPAAIAATALGLCALLAFYPRDVFAARSRTAYLLPLARCAALGALGIALLRPIVTRPADAPEEGEIAVLVDCSRSMGASDAGRPVADRVALAEGLSLIPATTVPVNWLASELDAIGLLIERVGRARSEAEYARLAARWQDSARQQLAQALASLRAACASVASRAGTFRDSGDLPRLLQSLRSAPLSADAHSLAALRERVSQARQAVERVHARLNEAVYASDGAVRALCDSLDAQPRIELARRALAEPRRGLLDLLPNRANIRLFAFGDELLPLGVDDAWQALGTRSDPAEALRQLLSRYGRRPPRAVVLLSDGRRVAAGNTQENSGSVPVFAVSAAPLGAGRDLAVTRMLAPSSAYRRERIPVRVDVRATGFTGQTVAVHLAASNRRLTQNVALGEAVEASAIFNVEFDAAGPVELHAEVDAARGERSTRNNAASTWIKVGDGSVAVTLAAGARTRDVRAMSESLDEAAWVRLRQEIVSSDAEVLSLTSEDILHQDVLVLSDVNVWSLTQAQWEAVDRLVTERGGTLLLAVSDPQVLRQYAQHPTLSRFLPFDPAATVTWRTRPGDHAGIRLAPPSAAPDGRVWSPLDGSWQALPPVVRAGLLPTLKPNAHPLLVEARGQAAVLAEARMAAGRVALLTTDETWRWERPAGEPGGRFWATLVRHCAGGPPSAATAAGWIDVEPITTELGRPVLIRAGYGRWRDAGADGEEVVEVELRADGQALRTVPLVRQANGINEAILTDLPEGIYEVRLATGDDLVPEPSTILHVSTSSVAELANLAGDERTLRSIAESTGGQFLRLDELVTLPRRLGELHRPSPPPVEYALWSSPYLFCFVLGCLALEWAMRKQMGLA